MKEIMRIDSFRDILSIGERTKPQDSVIPTFGKNDKFIIEPDMSRIHLVSDNFIINDEIKQNAMALVVAVFSKVGLTLEVQGRRE